PAQPGPDQVGQVRRSGLRRHRPRARRLVLGRRLPGHLLHPPPRRHRAAPDPVPDLGVPAGVGDLQRGQPDRRHGRARLGLDRAGGQLLCGDGPVAVPVPVALPPGASPRDPPLVAAAIMGATAGFLWWNAPPARIFMGDTGSLALGGTLAALALFTNTQLLLAVLGGLYVVETLSVILQVASFRLLERRVFKMAPIHLHFELSEWPEFTVIVRFWILAGLAVAFGLGLFYAEFLAAGGTGG